MLPGGYLTIGLGIALGVSALANVGLTNAYLGARDDAIKATADAGQARDTAKQCSDGVTSLQAAAERRATVAEAARDAAERASQAARKRADDLLGKRPSVPADDCRSAAVQMDDWLSTRGANK